VSDAGGFKTGKFGLIHDVLIDLWVARTIDTLGF
jgi:hypothetical protein